jgi:hypothetical protein
MQTTRPWMLRCWRIADAGHEPDQRIEPETHIDARQDEGRIKERCQRIDARDALRARTRPCELERGVPVEICAGISVRHCRHLVARQQMGSRADDGK